MLKNLKRPLCLTAAIATVLVGLATVGANTAAASSAFTTTPGGNAAQGNHGSAPNPGTGGLLTGGSTPEDEFAMPTMNTYNCEFNTFVWTQAYNPSSTGLDYTQDNGYGDVKPDHQGAAAPQTTTGNGSTQETYFSWGNQADKVGVYVAFDSSPEGESVSAGSPDYWSNSTFSTYLARDSVGAGVLSPGQFTGGGNWPRDFEAYEWGNQVMDVLPPTNLKYDVKTLAYYATAREDGSTYNDVAFVVSNGEAQLPLYVEALNSTTVYSTVKSLWIQHSHGQPVGDDEQVTYLGSSVTDPDGTQWTGDPTVAVQETSYADPDCEVWSGSTYGPSDDTALGVDIAQTKGAPLGCNVTAADCTAKMTSNQTTEPFKDVSKAWYSSACSVALDAKGDCNGTAQDIFPSNWGDKLQAGVGIDVAGAVPAGQKQSDQTAENPSGGASGIEQQAGQTSTGVVQRWQPQQVGPSDWEFTFPSVTIPTSKTDPSEGQGANSIVGYFYDQAYDTSGTHSAETCNPGSACSGNYLISETAPTTVNLDTLGPDITSSAPVQTGASMVATAVVHDPGYPTTGSGMWQPGSSAVTHYPDFFVCQIGTPGCTASGVDMAEVESSSPQTTGDWQTYQAPAVPIGGNTSANPIAVHFPVNSLPNYSSVTPGHYEGIWTAYDEVGNAGFSETALIITTTLPPAAAAGNISETLPVNTQLAFNLYTASGASAQTETVQMPVACPPGKTTTTKKGAKPAPPTTTLPCTKSETFNLVNQSDITILSQTNPAPANGSSNPLPTYGAPNVTFTPRTSDPLGAWTYEGSAPNTPGFIGVDHVTYRYCETAPVPEVTIPHQDACSTPGGGVTGSIGYTVTNDAISTSGWDPAPTFQEGQASTFNFLAEVNPYDPGALADTVSAPTLPAGWTATGSGADYTITPPKGFVGTATFTYTITDDTCSEAGGQTARGTCSVGSGVQGDFNNETKSVSVTATVNEASAT